MELTLTRKHEFETHKYPRIALVVTILIHKMELQSCEQLLKAVIENLFLSFSFFYNWVLLLVRKYMFSHWDVGLHDLLDLGGYVFLIYIQSVIRIVVLLAFVPRLLIPTLHHGCLVKYNLIILFSSM